MAKRKQPPMPKQLEVPARASNTPSPPEAAVASVPASSFKIRDRIIALERIPAGKITENRFNFRHHTPLQAKAILNRLKKTGWAGAAIVRKLPDGSVELLDGHLRKEISDPLEPIPCLIVNLTDEEAREHLLHYDAIGDMAEIIESKFRELSLGVDLEPSVAAVINGTVRAQERSIEDARQIVANIVRQETGAATHPAPLLPTFIPPAPLPIGPSILEDGSPIIIPSSNDGYDTTQHNHRGIWAMREDVIFPSKNIYGIPDLLPSMLSDQIPTETWARQAVSNPAQTLFIWGQLPPVQPARWSQAIRSDCKGGILSFYTYDELFESLWEDVTTTFYTIRQMEFGCLCQPDFSQWWQWPEALRIFNAYRAAWVARYYQEAGVKIIPRIEIGPDSDNLSLSTAGLPKRAPSLIVQCRTNLADLNSRRIWALSLTRILAALKPDSLIVYGEASRKWLEPCLPKRLTVHWLESWNHARKRVNPDAYGKAKVKKKKVKNENKSQSQPLST